MLERSLQSKIRGPNYFWVGEDERIYSPLLNVFVQCSDNHRAGTTTMSTIHRCPGWIIIMVFSMASSAPLDQERVYFPGENPDAAAETRSYRVPMSIVPHQVQQPFPHGEQSLMEAWSQQGIHRNEGVTSEHLGAEQPDLDVYGVPIAYKNEEQLQREQQYQPTRWETEPQAAHTEIGKAHGAFSHGGSMGSSYLHSSMSHGATSYMSGGPLHQGTLYSGLTDSGISHGGHKVTKHTYTSSHISTSGTGHLGHNQQQVLQQQGGVLSSQLGHSLGSSVHSTESQDFKSIFNGPSRPHSSSPVHPNIQQALDHVIKDFQVSQEKPSDHSIHKVSHVKKTTVQGVGHTPTLIKSTTTNDDINLSDLIEQLQALEQSPRHVNITWCEEKIREFLKALRRKQDSGIYINQQVQEQTLHQILTHEAVESNHQFREEVHEPVIHKVTMKPLGSENVAYSQQDSDFTSHEQESNMKGMADAIPGLRVNASQEGLQHQEDFDVITLTPLTNPSQPEIMSHKQEFPQEAPPFASENTHDLKELELELPEYPTFDHVHSGQTGIFDSSLQTETKLMSQLPSDLPISTGQLTSDNIPAENPEANMNAQDVQHEAKLYQQGSLSATLATSDGNFNIEQQGTEAKLHQELGTSDDSTQQQQTDEGGQSSFMETEHALGLIPSDEIPQHDVQGGSDEFLEGIKESNDVVRGRPQAPQEDFESAIESNQDEKQIKEQLPGIKLPESETVKNTSQESSFVSVQSLHKQQINYDTLIEELIQLESIPGHQAIDKCEEKIQEFLEILKYQQEQGFGRNQQELEKLHQTLIEQAKERGAQLANNKTESNTLSPMSFWKKVQKKIKKTYSSAKDRVKEVLS